MIQESRVKLAANLLSASFDFLSSQELLWADGSPLKHHICFSATFWLTDVKLKISFQGKLILWSVADYLSFNISFLEWYAILYFLIAQNGNNERIKKSKGI
jgi:hypothetical protein